MNNPIISKYGKNAVSIDWRRPISPETHQLVLNLEHSLSELFPEEIQEIVSAYSSMVIYLKPNRNLDDFIKGITNINSDREIKTKEQWTWSIPVCYDLEFGWDLEEISNKNGLSISEIIRLHTQPEYRIYFTGFLPGFLYLGGLNPQLEISRKGTPRLEVPKGAVAIGGAQTGIYPQKSPGGWQIIGQTPLSLFNVEQDPPSPFQPGDGIIFQSINKDRFEEIRAEIESGIYTPTKIKQND